MKKIKYIQLLILVIIGVLIISVFIIYNSKVDYFSVDMVDDVIHDKYEKNTNEYYIYRNKRDEQSLKKGNTNLLLYDNLAVGYNHIGDFEKAMTIYFKKKKLMNGISDNQNLYRYHANIGTFLIHKGLSKWFENKNNSYAQRIIILGKDHIKKAIEINIEAHFGRENYQLVAIEWIISTFDDLSLFQKENILGKITLDETILNKENSWKSCGEKYHNLYPEIKKVDKSLERQINDSCPMALRGLIGMIRFGGGPNPFSFSTVGDVLTSMGEYKIAFASYSRAVKLNHPSSDKIINYLKKLAKKILPNISEEEAYNRLLIQFEKDFKLGKSWSDYYIKYQKQIILEGINPIDRKSYDNFYKKYFSPVDIKYDR